MKATLCPFCGEEMETDPSGGLIHPYVMRGDDECYLNGVFIGSARAIKFQRRAANLWVTDDAGRPLFNDEGKGMPATVALCNDIINYLVPRPDWLRDSAHTSDALQDGWADD